MVGRVLLRVYARPHYWLITGLVSFVVFSGMVMLQSRDLLVTVFSSDAVSAFEKLQFFLTLYGSLYTSFTFVTGIAVVVIALLFGLNAALLLYFTRRIKGTSTVKSVSAVSLSSGVAALLGVGCAACGSAVVLYVLGQLSILWIVSYLPLHGAEFAYLGVFLLVITSYSLLKKIASPLVCDL